MWLKLKGEDGQVLPLVAILSLLLFLLAAAMTELALNSFQSAILQREQVQAYYTAEAGVEKTLARAVNEQSWLEGLEDGEYTDLKNFPYGDDGEIISVNINIKKHPHNRGIYNLTIESLGRSGGSKRAVKVNADVFYTEAAASLVVNYWQEKYDVF